MSREFNFFIKDNEVCCDIYENGHTTSYVGEDALGKLRYANLSNFHSISLASGDAILYCDRRTIVINNYNAFFQDGILENYNNLQSIIVDTIREKRRKRVKKKKLKQLGAIATTVALSATVAAIIGGTIYSHVIKDNNTPMRPTTIQVEEIPVNDVVSINGIQEEFPELELTDDEIATMLEDSITRNENITYLDYENIRDTEKGDHAHDEFFDIVEEYSTKWGISPNLVMCMLTQESGGYETNLMQIQFSSWEDQVIVAHNFNTGENQLLVLTRNQDRFKREYGDIICVSPEELKNPITNISVGCVILRESIRAMGGHICAGIQCYNLGTGNMNQVLSATANANNTTVDQLLSDQNNIEFSEFTNIIDAGDSEYLAHVIRYNENEDEPFVVQMLDESGNVYENSVTILPSRSR